MSETQTVRKESRTTPGADIASDPPTSPERLVDLTQHEIEALKTRYNLADAHTHQAQSRSQAAIVSDLPRLWYEAEGELQIRLEERFLDAFFTLHGQSTARRMQRTMLSYSASVSTMVAGLYLKQRGLSVALVEPCFDNLVDLLKHMQVPLQALPERSLHDPQQIAKRLAGIDADALYLVDPNNPTGFSLLKDEKAGFEAVAQFCADNDKVLIFDFCFLLAREVYVLPGTYFHWDAPQEGERFVRIALARRPESFAAAMRALREELLRVGLARDEHDEVVSHG